MRLSSIGDIVLTEPVVAALKEAFPTSEIGFAVKERFRDLVTANPNLSRIHVLRGGTLGAVGALCREVRVCRYSAVIDLHVNARSVALGLWSGAATVVRYAKRERLAALGVRVLKRPHRASRKTVERYLECLTALGVAASYRRPRYYLAEEHAAWAERFVERHGLRPRGFVAIAPGAVWPTKRWPADRYAEVARHLAKTTGLRAVFVGSARERDTCGLLAEAAGGVSAAGSATLGQAAAIISLSRLYIGNDSGPTHIAMALDVPTVAVFGPTDPGQFDFDGHALVYADLECSACSFYGGVRCRLGHWDCMRSISIERVVEAARGLLSDGKGDE